MMTMILGLSVLAAWVITEDATEKSRAEKKRMPVVYLRSSGRSTKRLANLVWLLLVLLLNVLDVEVIEFFWPFKDGCFERVKTPQVAG